MDEQQGANAASSFPWGEVITGTIGAVTTAFAWVFSGKRKEEAEVKGLVADSELREATAAASELENVQKAIGIWREMSEQFKAEAKTLHDECNRLRLEQSEMRMDMAKMRGQMDLLKAENKSLKEEIERLKAA